jgi:hypothetical protein
MKRTVMKSSPEPASDLVIAPKVTDRLQSYRSPEPASDLVIAPKVTDRQPVIVGRRYVGGIDHRTQLAITGCLLILSSFLGSTPA